MVDLPSINTTDNRPWYFNEYTGIHGRFVKCLGTCGHDEIVDGMTALLGVSIGPGHVIGLDRAPQHPPAPSTR